MDKRTNGKDEPSLLASRCDWMSDRPYRSIIEPGQRVRHPDRPDWGDGQVQSAVGDRITVNFEHQGKILINATLVDLDILS
jgi:hypothetical protein